MENQVVCYFDDMPDLIHAGGLSDLWHESWKRHGWEPRVSNHTWLPDHPKHEIVANHVKGLPTVNPPHYEQACFLRWLPAQTSRARMFVDMDTICNGWRPEHTEALNQEKFVSLIHNGNAAAAFMPSGFPVWEDILKYKPEHAVKEQGHPHCSDQEMFIWLTEHKREKYVRLDICKDYGDKGWDTAPMVHFSTGAVHRYGGGRTKRAIIKEFLGMW